jgi:hypothetical protein
VLNACSSRDSFSNGESLSSGLLLGDSCDGLVGLCDWSASLEAVELNMAVRGEVWGDTSMSTVGSSAAGDGALDNDVVDHALLRVESLGLSVGSQVDEEFTDGLGRLLWPSTGGSLVNLDLSVSSDAASELSERNNLFVSKHSLHVLDSSWDFHSLDESCCFVRVLEVSSEISDLAFRGCREKR